MDRSALECTPPATRHSPLATRHSPLATRHSPLVPHKPLKPAVCHILLALGEGQIHGLGIADWVEEYTGGAVELGPGTLYRTLKEMLELGLVRETPAPDSDADPRRRYYAITTEGRRRMVAEIARLDRLVKTARDRNFVPRRA